MRRPFEGAVSISQEYGVKNSAYRKGYHTGVDYRMKQGRRVVAPENGTIQQNGDGRAASDGRGYFVLFKGDSGTLHCLYHLKQMGVASGRVTEGTLLGYSGNTGASSGPHLHWETRKSPFDGTADYAPSTWLFGSTAYTPPVSPPKPAQKNYVRVFGDYRTVYGGIGSNPKGRILPNNWGGYLDYEVLARSGNFVKIGTQTYGQVWIYVGADVSHLTQYYVA